MADDVKSPNRFKIEHIAIVIQAALFLGGALIWVTTANVQSNQTATAMVTVNARLDRIFEKLDILPVTVEKVRQLEQQVTDSRGSYSTLDVRLRAIENNNAANHADIEAVKPKHGAN